jgi:hypothetical protein
MNTEVERQAQPLAGASGFCNRNSEIMRITSRIAAERPQSVSIVGEPKSGKTSLLHWLGAPQCQARFLDDPASFVFLRLDLAAAPPRDPEAFFALLIDAWRDRGEGPVEPSYDGIADWIRQLMQDGRRLVILLDDFGRVTASAAFPVGFFSFLRSIANGSDVGYVTTSCTDLQKLCSTQDLEESPFFNIFTTVHLEPFSEPQARLLAAQAWAEAGGALDPPDEIIVHLAGGSPYLLRLCAAVAAEHTPDRGDAEQTEATAYRIARPYLDCLWQEHFTAVQRDVLGQVQSGRPVARQQEYALAALERRGHVTQVNGSCTMRSALLARYVRERSGGLWKRLFG